MDKPRRSTAGKRQRRLGYDDTFSDEDDDTVMNEDDDDGRSSSSAANPLALAAAEAEENDDVEDEDDDDDDGSKLYCVCRQRWDGRFMVKCDGCGGWFHPACVGATKRDVQKSTNFYCPTCSRLPHPKAEAPERSTPAKKRRSSGNGAAAAATPATAAAATDMRQHIVNSLAECLGNTDAARGIAAAVERALHDDTEASAKLYKTRARSILYNLRDAGNQHLRDRVLGGAISPEELAKAAPDTLASPQLASARRALSQRALEKVVVTDDVAAPEYVREKRLLARVGSDEAIDAAAALSAAGSLVPSVSALAAATAATVVAALPGTPAWQGALEKSADKPLPGSVPARLDAVGWFVLGKPELAEMVPASLEVAGRLDLEKLFEYLQQLPVSASRRRAVLRLDPPAADPEAQSAFAAMHDYFMQRSRAGFVKAKASALLQPDGTVPEELYLVPLKSVESLPPFLTCDEATVASRAVVMASLNTLDNIPGGSSRTPRLLLVAVAKTTTIDEFAMHKAKHTTTATAAETAAETQQIVEEAKPAAPEALEALQATTNPAAVEAAEAPEAVSTTPASETAAAAEPLQQQS